MSQAPSRKPTNRELVAAKQAQATDEAPETTTAPQVPAVRNGGGDALSAYLAEVAPATMVGRLIKFKDGGYITVDDGKPVPEGSEFIVLADATVVGWIRFRGPGESPDRVMGLPFDGFVPPPRTSLGDLDKARWEIGLDGEPDDLLETPNGNRLAEHRDPRAFHVQRLECHGEARRRDFVAALSTDEANEPRRAPRDPPLQRRLQSPGQARRAGSTFPNLIVIGRAPRDSAAKPDTSLAADLDDEIPWK